MDGDDPAQQRVATGIELNFRASALISDRLEPTFLHGMPLRPMRRANNRF